MALVKCPECGHTRIVPYGKKKRCRKCGASLSIVRNSIDNPPIKLKTTGDPAENKSQRTPQQIRAKYPEQIEAILAEKTKEQQETIDTLEIQNKKLLAEIEELQNQDKVQAQIAAKAKAAAKADADTKAKADADAKAKADADAKAKARKNK